MQSSYLRYAFTITKERKKQFSHRNWLIQISGCCFYYGDIKMRMCKSFPAGEGWTGWPSPFTEDKWNKQKKEGGHYMIVI